MNGVSWMRIRMWTEVREEFGQAVADYTGNCRLLFFVYQQE